MEIKDIYILVPLVKNYLMLKAYAKVIREKVDEIENKTLQERPLFEKISGKQITQASQVWLCDLESNNYKDHTRECLFKQKKAGLRNNLKYDNLCPALIAENEVLKAKILIADAYKDGFWDILSSSKNCLENIEEFIEIICRLAVNHPKFKELTL